jgi:hypothetical protein
VPADEEVSHTMENVQEENMDGSSIVGGLMPVESDALTTETEARVRPPRTLREHAEREQALDDGPGDPAPTLPRPERSTGRSGGQQEDGESQVAGHAEGAAGAQLSQPDEPQRRGLGHATRKHAASRPVEQPEAPADVHDGLRSQIAHQVKVAVTVTTQGHGPVAQVSPKDFRIPGALATTNATEVSRRIRLANPNFGSEWRKLVQDTQPGQHTWFGFKAFVSISLRCHTCC